MKGRNYDSNCPVLPGGSFLQILYLASPKHGEERQPKTSRAVHSHSGKLTSWSRPLLEKLTGSVASQEIPRTLWNPKAGATLSNLY